MILNEYYTVSAHILLMLSSLVWAGHELEGQ